MLQLYIITYVSYESRILKCNVRYPRPEYRCPKFPLWQSDIQSSMLYNHSPKMMRLVLLKTLLALHLFSNKHQHLYRAPEDTNMMPELLQTTFKVNLFKVNIMYTWYLKTQIIRIKFFFFLILLKFRDLTFLGHIIALVWKKKQIANRTVL